MGTLSPAEEGFVLRHLTGAAPHLIGLAMLVRREDLWRVCRHQLTGRDIRIAGWDIRGRWFGIVVTTPPQREKRRLGGTIEWRTVAAHVADIAARQ